MHTLCLKRRSIHDSWASRSASDTCATLQLGHLVLGSAKSHGTRHDKINAGRLGTVQLLFQSLLALQLSLRDAGSTSHSANYPTRGLHGLQLSCMLFEDMSKLRRLVSSDLFAARRLFRSRPQISEPWSLQQLLPPSCCGDPLKRDGEFRIVWAWACTGLARPGEFPARPSTLFSL